MTESDVREIIRKEMRAFCGTLYRTYTNNHDAAEAIEQMRKAISQHFPESPREYAHRLDEYAINRSGAWLEDIGKALELKRGKMDDADYKTALLARRLELLEEK